MNLEDFMIHLEDKIKNEIGWMLVDEDEDLFDLGENGNPMIELDMDDLSFWVETELVKDEIMFYITCLDKGTNFKHIDKLKGKYRQGKNTTSSIVKIIEGCSWIYGK
jgi:hypothetical protein